MNEHPFWPSYFDPNCIVFDNDYANGWAFDENGDLCNLDRYCLVFTTPKWLVAYQIVSVTLLPDDLVWLRLISCPHSTDGGSDGGSTSYMIISRPIYERYATNRVIAGAWNGKKWIDSRRYRWVAQMHFDTYVPPDPEVFKQIAASLMHAFEPARDQPR